MTQRGRSSQIKVADAPTTHHADEATHRSRRAPTKPPLSSSVVLTIWRNLYGRQIPPNLGLIHEPAWVMPKLPDLDLLRKPVFAGGRLIIRAAFHQNDCR